MVACLLKAMKRMWRPFNFDRLDDKARTDNVNFFGLPCAAMFGWHGFNAVSHDKTCEAKWKRWEGSVLIMQSGRISPSTVMELVLF